MVNFWTVLINHFWTITNPNHQKLTGYLLFLEHGFGIVYLTSSIIGVIFCNLGTREEGTLSAYSVFNPNFERLQGTFSSDDFERNVLHRNSLLNKFQATQHENRWSFQIKMGQLRQLPWELIDKLRKDQKWIDSDSFNKIQVKLWLEFFHF